MFHFHRLKGGNVIFVSGIWGTSLAVLALEPRQGVECRLLPFYISIWWYIRHNLDAKHMYRHIYIYIYMFLKCIYTFFAVHINCARYKCFAPLLLVGEFFWDWRNPSVPGGGGSWNWHIIPKFGFGCWACSWDFPSNLTPHTLQTPRETKGESINL